MYSNTKLHIKTSNDFMSQSLQVEKGVKQGCVLSPTLFNIFINDLKDYLDKVNMEPPILNSTPINSLFYADDLVLISTSKKGLQLGLDTLYDFCSHWKLTVNLQKTQTIAFSKSCLTEKHYFTYGSTCIKFVKSYTYLGVTIKSNGSFSDTIINLAEKARKALYSLNKAILQNKEIKLPLHLFKVLIKPILLYGSEVWGQDYIDYSKWDKTAIERVNLNFCKTLLQTNRKSCNAAVRGELGQHPLLIEIKINIVKYWQHITQLPDNNLAKTAFIEQQLNYCHNYTWLNNLKSILENNSLNFLLDKDIPQNQTKIVTNIIRANLIHDYEISWRKSMMDDNSKLRTYTRIKQHFKLEPYLTQVHSDKRKLLTRFRISNHDLAIEKGRHTYPKTPLSERYCKHCNTNSIEDEIHFLLVCPKYKYQRENFLAKINIPNTSTANQFIFLMTQQGKSFNEQLSNFLFTLVNLRNT